MNTFGTTVKSWCHPYLHELLMPQVPLTQEKRQGFIISPQLIGRPSQQMK